MGHFPFQNDWRKGHRVKSMSNATMRQVILRVPLSTLLAMSGASIALLALEHHQISPAPSATTRRVLFNLLRMALLVPVQLHLLFWGATQWDKRSLYKAAGPTTGRSAEAAAARVPPVTSQTVTSVVVFLLMLDWAASIYTTAATSIPSFLARLSATLTHFARAAIIVSVAFGVYGKYQRHRNRLVR